MQGQEASPCYMIFLPGDCSNNVGPPQRHSCRLGAAHSGPFCGSFCGDHPGTARTAHQLTLAPLPGILGLPLPAVPPAVRTPVKALPGVLMAPPILRRPCLPRCAQVVVVTLGQLSLPAAAATHWPQTQSHAWVLADTASGRAMLCSTTAFELQDRLVTEQPRRGPGGAAQLAGARKLQG